MPSKELRKYKEIAKDLTIDDTAAAIDMTVACLKNTGGRPCTYANTESGLNDFIENAKGYFTYVQNANSKLDEKSQLIPDIEGLTLFIGIDRSTLCRYRERGGEWERVIDYIKNSIGYSKKQLILKGKVPAVVGIFDMVNNHGYRNTNSFVLESKAAANKADTELENEAMAAGMIWNESTREWELKE